MGIRCVHCGNENLDQARFCMHCSQPLSKTCARCGGTAALGARFCPHCGATLAVTPPVPTVLTGRLQSTMVLAGRYQIVRKLGQGGMGAVYLAQDLRLGSKQWAIKEMSDAVIADPAERQQAVLAFQQEAQMLAALDHANLPKVIDYFSEQTNQYLVMEFVQGEPLDRRLEKLNGPLPEPQVMKYVEQLCDVLDYLHGRQPSIIFRDLKPGNMIVQPDDRLKLIDFGIARHFKPGQSKDTQRMGTPGYAAPEQYGQGQSDARSDIYALGATMHHMLTGRDPGTNPFYFERVRTLNPHVSVSVDEGVAKAVAMQPGQRWQTIPELRQALHSPVKLTPDVVIPPVPPPLPKPKSAQGWVWALIVGVILVVTLIRVGQSTQTPAAPGFVNSQSQDTATAEAQVTQQAQATAEAQFTQQAQATAEAQFTQQAQATAEAGEQSAAVVTNNLLPLATRVTGPLEGSLAHNADDNNIVSYDVPAESLRNFVAEAHFHNPYSAATGTWDYGFGFRNTGKNQEYRLVIQSDGSWKLYLFTGDSNGDPLVKGSLANLDTASAGENFVQLWVKDEWAYFYVNKQYIATLDVAQKNVAGSLWLGTGLIQNDETNGKFTQYTEFSLWSLPDPQAATATATETAIATPAPTEEAAATATDLLRALATRVSGPLDGTLAHNVDDGDISTSDAKAENVRNFVAEVHFHNPYSTASGTWDYGFGFRDTGADGEYRLIVQSDGNWSLRLRNGDKIDVLTKGIVANLDLAEDGDNALQLWAKDDLAYFYVNKHYVATLDISQKNVTGFLWLGTGFFKEDEINGHSTRYTDFTIWSLPE